MADVAITYRRPTSIHVGDCRNGPNPFVDISVTIADGSEIKLFCEPDLARQLHHKLDKLFPGDDVTAQFKKLFGHELTCDVLQELHDAAKDLVDAVEQRDFPATVDPVAAIERKPRKDINFVVAAVDSETVIEIGDLLWQDVDDVKPAAAFTVGSQPYVTKAEYPPFLQNAFADKFLGVAMQRSWAGDTDPIRVVTTGVFEFDCPSSTFKLGGLMGVRFLDIPLGRESEPQDRSIHRLANQEVVPVIAAMHAIGRVAKRCGTPTTSVHIDIHSRVMRPI